MNTVKHSTIAATALALIGIASSLLTPAAAQTYIEVRSGGVSMQDGAPGDGADFAGAINGAKVSFDTGWLAAVAVGRDIAGPLRAEIEYSHRSATIGRVTGSVANAAPPPVFIPFAGSIAGRADVDAIMVNGYVDTAVGNGPFEVYVGIGAGIAFTDTRYDGIGRSDTQPAFQTMLGVSYEVSEAVKLTGGYTLFVVENVDFGNDEIDMTTHSMLAGLQFEF